MPFKFFKFKLFKALQPPNIEPIFITFSALKLILLKSKLVKDLHSLNISPISLTEEVSKL